MQLNYAAFVSYSQADRPFAIELEKALSTDSLSMPFSFKYQYIDFSAFVDVARRSAVVVSFDQQLKVMSNWKY